MTAVSLLYVLAVAASAACAGWAVFRPSRTFNDLFVASQLVGAAAVLGLWGWGLAAALPGPLAGAALLLAVLLAASLCALFRLLLRGGEPGPLDRLAVGTSQLALSLAFWGGAVLLLRLALAIALERSLPPALAAWARPGPDLLLAFLLAAWGVAWTRLGARTRHHRLALLERGGPVRLLHLSDLHYCAVHPASRLRRLFERGRELGPDLVAVTGDLVTPFGEDEPGPLLDALSAFDCPVFVVSGNHDRPSWDRLAPALEARGFHVLDGRVEEIELRGARLRLLGLGWGRDPAELPHPAEGALEILLVHDPAAFRRLPPGRRLVLAGHTHGGQLSLEMLGVPWSPLRLLGVYTAGFYRRGGNLLRVHRGNQWVGVPPRLGVAPELVLLELVGGSRS